MNTVTSESVTEGHPDKLADQISDAILDAILTEDSQARVACEVLVTTGLVVVAGEISTSTYVDVAEIARRTICDVGYDRAEHGFDGRTCGVLVALDQQSPDIAQGVDIGGAGDQGMMFGYACSDTLSYMPASLAHAHQLTRALADERRSGRIPYLRPDGKAQVTVQYDPGFESYAITDVVISTQHADGVDHADIVADVRDLIVDKQLGELLADDYKLHVNPTGRFVVGGPQGDVGLTGRKIIVDTYGGVAHHGGGAFSGKDPSKVDRSAAYAARWAALNVVAAGLAKRCEVQLAYAIGVAEPVSINVDTFGTSDYRPDALEDAVRSVFNFTPHGIIEALRLRWPIYQRTAAYGHFGRQSVIELNAADVAVEFFPWELANRAYALREAIR